MTTRRTEMAFATLALAISAAVLSGCSDGSDAPLAQADVTTTASHTARPPLSESDVAGLVAHQSVEEMMKTLNDFGIPCTNLTYDTPLYEDGEAGTCVEPSNSGIPLETYGSFEHLAESVAGIEGLLTLGSPWMPNYVIGKNWTAICGQPGECESLANALGGTARTAQ